MPLDVETIAELLRENAERFHSLAKDDPLRADSLEAQALKCEKLIEKISNSEPASRKVRGPWTFCPLWLYPDRLQWGKEADSDKDISANDIESEDLRSRLTRALMAAQTGKTNSGEDDSLQVTDEDARSAHFSKPPFLPGVILAQLTKEVAKDGDAEAWIAFYSITQEASGDYQARSFDFKAEELHRLNTSVPLQLVGHELEYLRYFMYIVRGDAGAFRLLDEDVLTRAQGLLRKAQPQGEEKVTSGQSEDDPVATALDIMGSLLPTHFVRVTVGGAIAFQANILYSATMFSATLLINPDGTVEMLNDVPLCKGRIEGLGE